VAAVWFGSGATINQRGEPVRPQKPTIQSNDLLRSSLEAIIEPEHALIRLTALIDRDRFDDGHR
jgi:hypothetical protein